MLSDAFADIKPSSVPMFIAMQLVGGGLAIALLRWWQPQLPVVGLVIRHDSEASSASKEPSHA